MKRKMFGIFGMALCIVAILISIYNLRFDDKIGDKITNVISLDHDEIGTFIESIASVMLSSYEVTVTGDVLTNDQKKYITDMYILQNRNKYSDIVQDENGKNMINALDYNAAYYYIFGQEYTIANDGIVPLNDLNMEKFHISSYKIHSLDDENSIIRAKVEYRQIFLDKEFSYVANYIIGYDGGKYYLIGFTMEK